MKKELEEVLDEIILIAEDSKLDAMRMKYGNVTAGKRVRKKMQRIRSKAKNVRAEIQKIRAFYKVEKLKKKMKESTNVNKEKNISV
jgi:hypothetical protein